jgi:uncharacterized protein Veg
MKILHKETASLEDVKSKISLNIGKDVSITEINKQGKIIKSYTGTILDSYNSLFIVKVNQNGYSLNKSFSYVDFVTNEVSFEIIE